MPNPPRILALAGSLRAASFNKMLVKVAAQGAQDAGAAVTHIDLADYKLPIFDEDSEAKEGLPENALKLKELFKSHQGFLIASPEYNGSLSAALKNTIDWLTRPAPNEQPLECFTNKWAAIMSTSPGALGGIRALPHLETILCSIGVTILAKPMAVPKAHEVFNNTSGMTNKDLEKQIRNLGVQLANITSKLDD